MKSLMLNDVDTQHLNSLITEHAKWSQATFGLDTEHGPEGAIKHLAKEVQEALEAWHNQSSNYPTELADCMILLLEITRRSGFNFAQIILYARQKMQINMQRKWQKPANPNEPVEHIR